MAAHTALPEPDRRSREADLVAPIREEHGSGRPAGRLTSVAFRKSKNGHAWPVCQGKHPHPMSLGPGREGSWPFWYCPKNPSYRFAVGEHPGR